ncbi:hypothetical protein N2152v2_002191 [Parachlorella kessleri]
MVAKPNGIARKGTAIQERLAREVLRKLRLAADEAEEKEDRDIICSEVFADITGDLNSAAKGRTWEASEALLAVCRRLWGQPFTTPIYALLLHQWLLIHKDAGGSDQRLKHLNVLVSGARQLFIGDVETSNTAFQPLYTFVAEQVVLAPDKSRLRALPSPGREAIMGLVASFLPYYGTTQELLLALSNFPAPSPSPPGGPGGVVARQPALTGQAPPAAAGPGGGVPGEGADFLISRIVDTISKEVRSEEGLVKYLRAVMALRGSPYFAAVPTATRVRLQGEIYSLTQSGGPRYAPRSVNKLAFKALDSLFPHGKRTRRLINLGFRFLHPQDWPWFLWDMLLLAVRALWLWVATLCGAAAAAGRRLRLPRRRQPEQDW